MTDQLRAPTDQDQAEFVPGSLGSLDSYAEFPEKQEYQPTN